MIDVIIPVYNSGRNIARALSSVADQVNYKDICVYIVDDCSTENYDDILNHFKKYLNITYLRLDKNSGPGVARNLGLEKSKNDFIVFLDSDDEFYSKDSVLKLYNSMGGYDVVVGQMQQEVGNETVTQYHEGCLHGKMYRRSFLEKNNIKFHDIRIKGGNAHEDNAFNELCFSVPGKIKYIPNITYRYKDIDNSITNSESKVKSYKCYIKSVTWLFEQLDKKEEIKENYVARVIVKSMFYIYFNYLLAEEEYSFCFEECSFLKTMYNKYLQYTNEEEILRIYKNFNYPVVPDISFKDFMDKIV